MEFWFSELQTPNVKLSIRVDRQLYSGKSEFQRIDVFESPEFGRFLTLDGYMMLTEKDEFIYHEMITHVPMAVHPNVKKVLVIGAGDGGVVRELTRYQEIEQIDLVEIDELVVEVCKKYLPQTACRFDDPRVHIHYEDGLKFVRTCGIPGMKVMVFAFDPVGESAYLPHNCEKFSVVYTGTHDTPTFVQFLQEGNQDEARFARQYLRLRDEEGIGWGVISGAWATSSYLAIAPLQDVLGLGADSRMNTPGSCGGHNWSWRVREDAFNPYVSGRLREITRTYRRCL